MKYLILCLMLTAGCATTKPAQCDQNALDQHSAEIGAYEITCEELEDL
jgi:hypothetical protein